MRPRRAAVALVAAAAVTGLAAPPAIAQPAVSARATFAGTVVNGAGEAIRSSGLVVTLINSSNTRRNVPVQADGTFATTVNAGLFTLTVTGRAYADLTVNVRTATGALDLSGSRNVDLTLPSATLTATVATSAGDPIAGAGVALPNPGCTNTAFTLAAGLAVTGKWNEGGAAPATTSNAGVATRTVLPCAVTTTYRVTPPTGGVFDPATASVAPHSADVAVAVTLYPQMIDRATAAGLYEVNETWSAKTVDYNGDGLEDIWVGYHQRDGKLWRNNGDGTYTRVAEDAWPATSPDGLPTDRHDCDWADVDGNGLPDAACAAGRDKQNYVKPFTRDNELWLQLTPGQFTEVGSEWGIGDPCGRSRHVALFDANNDGYPDLFVGNELPRDDPNDPCDVPANNLPNHRSKFYLNTGGTGFQFAPQYLDPGFAAQRCAKSLDYNDDGWMDLLTCNNKDQPASLFRNDHGTGFTDVSAQVGLTAAVSDVDIVDFDGDGDPDLVNTRADGWDYQLNEGGTFAAPVSIYHPTTRADPIAVSVGDVDGDGDLDVYCMFGRLNTRTLNANDVVLLNTPGGYRVEAVPPAVDGRADHVLALHPNGPDQPAQFLVLNGYQEDNLAAPGGPIQLITAASG